MKGLPEADFFRHLWDCYQATIDKRQKYGDVTLLAEAAERMTWPSAPQIGPAIAEILRDQIIKNKVGAASKHYRNVRAREIEGLASVHLSQGMTANASHERIAAIFNMTPDAVRKSLERKTADK